MEANLTRLTDLTGEIRRQLKPLGRQAEVARKAAVIQAEARDARLRLLADDLRRSPTRPPSSRALDLGADPHRPPVAADPPRGRVRCGRTAARPGTRPLGPLPSLARAAADRREGLAKLAGQVGARRSRIEAREAEIGRLEGIVAASLARAAEAEKEFAALESTVADDEEGEVGLDGTYEVAEAQLADLEGEIESLLAAERDADRDRASAKARLEALELSLRRRDGAAALLAAADDQRAEHGIVGAVSTLLTITGGHEHAVAAALGWASEALAVGSSAQAASALDRLRSEDAGQAAMLVADTARRIDPSTWPSLDAGAVWARDVVDAPAEVAPAVEQLLERVALVPSVPHALALVARGDGVTAVTADGDVFGPGYVRGGSSSGQSTLELQAAADETRQSVEEASSRADRAKFALVTAREKAKDVAARVDAALEALHESDARMAAVAERLGTLGAAARNARAEADRTTRAISEARRALETDQAELTALAARLEEASAQPDEVEEPSTDERDRLELEASKARTHETELRLTLRTKEERARAVKGRAESLEGAARNELAARERLRQRQERRQREAGIAEAVAVAAAYAHERIATALGTAAQARDRAETGRAERDQAIHVLRQQMSVHQDELRELTDTAHRDEVARARQVARIEQLQAKAIEELGIDPEVLMEDFGPQQPIPFIAGPDHEGELPEPGSFVREDQEKRLRRAERGLSALGRVNPLALEEFEALEQRHKFLTEQLTDLNTRKRDLLDDHRRDRREDRRTSSPRRTTTPGGLRAGLPDRLFPGGTGGIHLTDPSTCSPRASRSRPALRARRSSACRCSPVGSARSSPSPCSSRSSRPGPARSTSWTRSRPPWMTRTSGDC
jgi:chromosome segregation protein